MASAYTSEQIDLYFDYISLPLRYRRKANPPADIDFLTSLHIHQITAIPYENLSLHYSPHHDVILDPQVLFKKVTTNGRGGYCMENNIFFNHILRALGFSAYTVGARIRYRVDGIPQGDYIGWTHMVNIITFPNGTRYVSDVGFGGDGATKPLPLDQTTVTHNMGTQELRLQYSSLPHHVDQTQRVWIYQYRNGTAKEWNSFYSFPEMEFLAQDFEIMNWFTSKSPNSFQTYTPIVVKFLKKPEEETIYGKVMLVKGDVKRNINGKTVLVKTCKTEKERVEALREYFGIILAEDEIMGIKGWVTELIEE